MEAMVRVAAAAPPSSLPPSPSSSLPGLGSKALYPASCSSASSSLLGRALTLSCPVMTAEMKRSLLLHLSASSPSLTSRWALRAS